MSASSSQSLSDSGSINDSGISPVVIIIVVVALLIGFVIWKKK